jgi:tripartite-type tricarboxylate transporter receptor subunit TctC
MKRKVSITLAIISIMCLMLLAACSSTPSSSGNASTQEQPAASAGAQGGTANETQKTDFPSNPITIIVHTSAGGPTDLMARELAKAASPILGQSIVVENRPGGSGATQMAAVATAKPDGYTLGTLTPSQIGAWNSNLKGKFSIDSFSYIQGVQIDPYIIVVNAESPYKTLQDLIEDMKKNPNKITVGGYGAVGSGHNVAWNILAEKAGVKANWTAFESTGDAVTALLGKHIMVANSNPGQVSQYVKAGKLRILGVMADKRLESFPDVPTYAEAGYPVDTSWAQFRGIFGPANIPQDVVDKLNSAFSEAMQTEEFKKYMQTAQLEDGNMNQEEFTNYVKNQDKLSVEWLKKLGASQ